MQVILGNTSNRRRSSF